MRSIVGSFASAAVLMAASTSGQAQTLHATLEGYQEVPTLSTAGTGNFRARIDKPTGTIYWQLSYAGLEADALQAHIHVGAHGTNGGVSVFLCSNLGTAPAGTLPCPPRSAELSGVITAGNVLGPVMQGIGAGQFDELVAAMRRGVTYVNVHSTDRPTGEIRGQITEGAARP